MLVSWAPTTFARRLGSCKALTGGYRLPNVRELLGSYQDLLLSPLPRRSSEIPS